jgi:hypothetical protein
MSKRENYENTLIGFLKVIEQVEENRLARNDLFLVEYTCHTAAQLIVPRWKLWSAKRNKHCISCGREQMAARKPPKNKNPLIITEPSGHVSIWPPLDNLPWDRA